MIGITPIIDEHATWAASQGKGLRHHIKHKPDVVTVPEHSNSDISAKAKGGKRHLRTILAAACRYSDRLCAANIIQSDKCAHAQTGMNIYCEAKESSHHHGKCTGCMQTHTSAAKFKPKIQRHTVASNSRAHMCKTKSAMTDATCIVHHKDLQPKSTSI